MDLLIHTILNDLTINYIRGNMGTIGGLLMSIDDMFKKEEKKIRKLFDTKLLSELLLLNYQYSNNEYLGTTAEDVYNSLAKKFKYTKKEKFKFELNPNMSRGTCQAYSLSVAAREK